MKRTKYLIVLLAAIIILYPAVAWASVPYQEINSSQGKVIAGLDREKAYQMFGAPASKGDGVWCYAGPTKFFVIFSEIPSILLYPSSSKATVGVPLEFKVFLSLADSGIQDITKEAQLVFDRPECVKIQSPGVIIPKRAGEYSALAIYKGFLSNPFYIQIKETKEGEQKEKEKLLSIDVLPYRPTVIFEGVIDFVALGTFYEYDLNKYSVRNVSQEAVWFMRQRPNLTWNKEENQRLYFLEKGQAEILSKYKDIESFFQLVEIKDKVDFGVKKLKHLLVLPEVMVVPVNSSLNLKVFGTYSDNSVAELTQEVDWKIADQEILGSNENGYFLCKSEGITEVTATKDGTQGLPVKVIVVKKGEHFLNISSAINPAQENTPDPDTLGQIKDNVEKLKKDFFLNKKELKSIKIMPELLEIGLGEEGKFSAVGFYSDGSSSDLAIFGNWVILDKSIASVPGGKVVCFSVGQTSVYVEFKGVRSEYASLVVGGPKLTSLLLTPQSLRIPKDRKASFKVQGDYYDHSQRDITKQVDWAIEGPKVVNIDNGVVRSLKFGRTKIYAKYSHLKSNTASIDVVMTLGWLLWLLAKIMLVLLLCIFCVVYLLYLLAQNKRKKLRLLKDKPREFILGLHKNATRLITIFGLRYDNYTFPIFYAGLVKQKFLVEDNVFLNFTMKFEEAKYSQHILQDSDVAAAVNDYNDFFQKLCKNKNRMLSFYRNYLALIHCQPIFIFSAIEVNGENSPSA